MASERIVRAAGGVVWRRRPGTSRKGESGRQPTLEILTIHRPSYDDWTLPKGKVDPGEAVQTTAVREIAEETGLRVRLGVPLRQVTYEVATGDKVVDYWSARLVGASAAEPFVPNREVDAIRWVGVGQARDLLTYEHDHAVLETFGELREHQHHRSRTIIVLRHGKASPRAADQDDVDRPLTPAGATRAAELVPLLGAYGIRRVVSSPAVRCAQTVEPYAHSISTFIEVDDRIGEHTRPGQVQRSVGALMDRKKPVVLCTHRPTLPWIFDAIGAEVPDLAPGEAVVLHHRKGLVVAIEKLA